MIDVRLHNLSKSFNDGEIRAVRDVSFSVEKGELFGLIGPDGAGKTTIFRMLTTLLLPDSGTASVNGLDIVQDYRAIRSQVGYMPGKFSLYQDLTIEENLNFFAALFRTSLKENYDLIKDIYDQIAPFKKRRAGKLSGGMKQKLALCCALIHRPTVLFLDEPTTGVDAVSRKEFWEMLKQLQKQDISILVSTPYMDEANLCDRIALIQSGEIMSIDTPENIIKNYPKPLYAAKASDQYELLQQLESDPEVESCFTFGEHLHITFYNDNDQDGSIQSLIERHPLRDLEIHRITPSIEDSFIRLMRESTAQPTHDGQ